jgi:hypothetical protein
MCVHLTCSALRRSGNSATNCLGYVSDSRSRIITTSKRASSSSNPLIRVFPPIILKHESKEHGWLISTAPNILVQNLNDRIPNISGQPIHMEFYTTQIAYACNYLSQNCIFIWITAFTILFFLKFYLHCTGGAQGNIHNFTTRKK